ncbi:maleylacetate reductase [Pseudomonas silesiensis]|uniref:maleylacetate reductase n=1 Tax=Pseudomonas silesiensis TaxID=1853130 RepID=UPI0030CFAE49
MPTSPFIYNGQPSRVIFGQGSLQQLEAEIDRLGAKRALVLCTPEQRAQAENIARLLGSRAADIFDKAVMHVPIETAREARELARKLGADCAVAIGGGSTTGLGKAIAMDSGLPILAIPTTYAGSEMTPVFGLTENGLKRTGKDPRVLPKTVIYDSQLTVSLPVDMSITSGMNAIAHAAEGLYAQDGNPVMSLMAEEGIRALAAGMKTIRHNPSDLDARDDCLYGAWLCGTVLGNVGMALHHKLCHTLGGSFNLPHAQTHTIVLPHAIAYNQSAAPGLSRICRALNVEDCSPAAALFDLSSSLGAPTRLKDLGLTEADLDRATDIAMSNPYWNPRPIEAVAIRQLLQNAFDGERPQ